MRHKYVTHKRLLLFLLPVFFVWFFQILQRFSFAGELFLSVLPPVLFLILAGQLAYILISIKRKTINVRTAILMYVASVLLLMFQILMVFTFYLIKPHEYIQTDNSEKSIKIMSLNTYHHNINIWEVTSIIRSEKPDVVMLYEYTQSQRNILRGELSQEYPYEMSPYDDENGMFSKIQPSESRLVYLNDGYGYEKIKISKEGVDYYIYGIHPPAMCGNWCMDKRLDYVNTLTRDISGNTDNNIIIAGDYNLSPWVWGYSDLINKLPYGFFNAGQGNGFYATWGFPPGVNLPLSTIDHIVMSGSLRVVSFDTLWVKGSDHRALFVKILPASN